MFYRSSKNGVVGYRLFENELHIYGNEQLTTEYEMTVKIESSIKEYFTGQVHFRSLEQILVPQCTIRCGDFIRNNTNDKMGTLGIFGEIKGTPANKSVKLWRCRLRMLSVAVILLVHPLGLDSVNVFGQNPVVIFMMYQ